MNIPVLILIALAGPLGWGISWWIANRPEKLPDLAPGETELEFAPRESLTFGLSHEYLAAFLYELRAKFENGWTLGHVAGLLVNVLDRRVDWGGRYVVTAGGTADELMVRFCHTDRDSVVCCLEMPRAFVAIVRRVVEGYPVKNVG